MSYPSTLDLALASPLLVPMRTVRVAIYLRVSTQDQVLGYGLDTQLGACNQRMGLEPSWASMDVYSDAVSGKTADRPNLIRLLKDARSGLIDVVLVYKLDRIGRKQEVFWRIFAELSDLDIEIVSVTQPIDTRQPGGKMAIGMFAAFAEMELETIGQRMRAGQNIKAAQNGWPAGHAPYGYRIQDKGKRGSYLVIDEEEARCLRFAVQVLVTHRDPITNDALNTNQVVQILNHMGFRKRNKSLWHNTDLRRILFSPAMYGISHFRSTNALTPYSQTMLNKDGTPKYGETIEIQLPRIFTDEELVDLYCVLKRGAPRGGPTHPFLLRQRVFGVCSSQYRCHGRPDRIDYECANRVIKGTCMCASVDAPELDDMVWQLIKKLLDSPGWVERLAEEYVSSVPDRSVELAARIKKLEESVDRQQNTIVDSMVTFAKIGATPEQQTQALAKLNRELEVDLNMRNAVQAELEIHRNARQKAADLVEVVNAARMRYTAWPMEVRRELVELLDVRVTVTGPSPARRKGYPCAVRDMFERSGLNVPDTALTDEQWALVEPLMPPKHGRTGRSKLDLIFMKVRENIPWRELPVEDYSDLKQWESVFTTAKKWARDGLLEQILKAMGDYEGGQLQERNPLPPVRISVTDGIFVSGQHHLGLDEPK